MDADWSNVCKGEVPELFFEEPVTQMDETQMMVVSQLTDKLNALVAHVTEDSLV